MIDKASIENLSQRIDIVDIISHFIEVKKQGSSYICVCPFHNDKNPSMHINSQKGFYHCFSCKAGGDVFKFVMDYEKISFKEAVEKVATLSNFTLTYTKEKKEQKDLKYILPLLNAFYKENLPKHKEILSYLYSRKLNDQDIKKFELGFAPKSEETLRLLTNENINFQDALEVGAIKNQDKEFYASFIQRITFPIYDHKNILVGFGGRTLNTSNLAKYVNSPQNKLFDKSRIFYAFNIAKDYIAQKKEIIICEGYMDAIAFHKAGLNNAVAVLGTALTQNHLPLIKRYDAKVILCFDNDNAGLQAAFKSAFLLSTNKIDGKVVLLEGGKDPAELVANNQNKALFQLLEQGIELGEFYIKTMLDKFPLKTMLDKQKALENIQKYTFLLEPLIANSYKNLVSKLLGVEENFIYLSKNSNQNKNLINLYNNPQKIYLSEFEILDYLFKEQKARELFHLISDKACFKHQNILEKIFQNIGLEDSDIRELYLKNFRKLENENEFLLGICKINLAFLNQINIKKTNLALKKQIFSLLEKNSEKLKKNLNQNELFLFLKDCLITLKQERNEENLELFFKHLYKILSKNYFTFIELNLKENNHPF
ncbi:DNA primase [Campylobacter sp. TTU-622]|uniref:DNA primase n=1 Tax=unclassified Campylobacter TaxID=2593542 RepID=UPI00190782F2|nr:MULTISPECIES: DNA primase [unclassified Campylobacter]MBK1972337.1 DNA primase [Campylobacter sp. TTU_617]MBK1972990.1 DNA primase [Campylobacter sp. TTU-622]